MIKLLTGSHLERATSVTISVATVADFGVELLYDRDRVDQCQAQAAGQVDVDVVLPVGLPADTIGFANHNIGAGVQVYADTASPIGTTLLGTVLPAGIDPFLGAVPLTVATKWRYRFLVFGAALKLGELMPWVVTTLPSPRLGKDSVKDLANVEHDFAIGGFHRGVELAIGLAELPHGYDAMEAADVALVRAAFADCGKGSGNVFLQTRDAVLRWAAWLNDEIDPVPIGAGKFSLDLTFKEVL